MPKLCEKCGQKNGFFGGNPLLLNNEKFLCSKCAIPIKEKIDEIYNVKSETDFAKFRDEIIRVCKNLYSNDVIEELKKLMNRIYDRKGFISNQSAEKQETMNGGTFETTNTTYDKASPNSKENVLCFDSQNNSVLKIQHEQLKVLKNIESMVKFFFILTIIGISLSVISFFIILANL